MTLVSGAQMFYSVKNVGFCDLCTILRQRAASRGPSAKATVYLDVSWMARKLSTASNNPVDPIIDICSKFISEEIKVVLCLDNRHHRHHSKKATIIRMEVKKL